MYNTLYRKYRPKKMSEVSGQTVALKILNNQIENNNLNHCYIFSGPRGTGKTSVAKIFSAAINCTEDNKPCGNCVSCKQNINYNLDIIEIDAASNNGVDEIRELKSKVNIMTSYSKYKIYIIDEVHMLTISAFNALLKTLEEPPAHIIFILATTEIHKVPETIMSRCQQITFNRISEEDIFLRLKEIIDKEKINITSESLYEIARLSNGGLRDAIGHLDLLAAYKKDNITIEDVHEVNGTISEKEISNIILNIKKNNEIEILNIIESLNKKGKNIHKVLEEVNFFLRNCLVNDFSKTKKDVYSKIYKIFNKDKIINMINFINQNLIEIKKYGNNNIMYELIFINLVDKFGHENNDEKYNNIQKEKESVPIEPVFINKLEQLKTPELINEGNIEVELNKEDVLIKSNVEKEIEILKRVRIDNTFAQVSKTRLNDIKQLFCDYDHTSLNEKYHKNFHLIKDGKIVAASDKNLIIVFETQTISSYYNKNIKEMEKIIKKILNVDFESIALENSDWENYRNEFKNKKREYVYKNDEKEFQNYIESFKKTKNVIESTFSNLINIR